MMCKLCSMSMKNTLVLRLLYLFIIWEIRLEFSILSSRIILSNRFKYCFNLNIFELNVRCRVTNLWLTLLLILLETMIVSYLFEWLFSIFSMFFRCLYYLLIRNVWALFFSLLSSHLSNNLLKLFNCHSLIWIKFKKTTNYCF